MIDDMQSHMEATFEIFVEWDLDTYKYGDSKANVLAEYRLNQAEWSPQNRQMIAAFIRDARA